jgi:hypothetical protein
MKAFFAAVLGVAAISFGASLILETFQRTADESYVGSGARIEADPRLRGPAPKG